MKYAWYIVAVLAVLAVGSAGWWIGHRSDPQINITTPTETQIVYRSLPAKVVTAQDGHEIAKLDTTLVSASGQTSVGLGVRYDEKDNLFDLDARIQETPKKPKAISFIADAGVAFSDSLMPRNIELGAGVLIREKYSVTLFGRSDKTFGIRCGVRF